jgi:hypothetical protein
MSGTEGQEKRETHSEFAARKGAELDAEAQKVKDAGGTPNDEHTDAGDDAGADEGTPTPAAADAPKGAEGKEDADEDDDAGEEVEEEGEDEEEGDDEDPDEDEDAPSGEFARAAGRHNIPLSLEDLPEEARPLVKQRLKAIEKGFTKAMMDARGYRADERYRTEHPVDFIAEMLLSDPELEQKVSDELAKRGDETYRESRKIISERDRQKAAEATDEEQEAADARANRGSEVETLTRKACQKYNIPFGDAVEAAIANIVLTSDEKDIDDADIPRIVKRIAEQFGATRRKENREERKEVVKDKVKDRASGPRIRPGSGRPAPSRGAPAAKLTLEQKITRSVANIFPGAD